MNDLYNKRDSVYKEYHKMLNKELNNTADEFLLGKPTGNILNLFNLYHLQLQIGSEDHVNMTKEDIKCMSDTLFCNGVYANHMNDIYEGDWSREPDPGGPSPSKDGVGFMQIEGKGVYPINRIR